MRTNDRMDRDEVKKAQEKLDTIDKSGRKVRLMTAHLTGACDEDEGRERESQRQALR